MSNTPQVNQLEDQNFSMCDYFNSCAGGVSLNDIAMKYAATVDGQDVSVDVDPKAARNFDVSKPAGM